MSEIKELLTQLQKIFSFWNTALSLDENLHAVVDLAATMLGADRFLLVDRVSKPATAPFDAIKSMTRNVLAPEQLHHLVVTEGRSMLIADDPHHAHCVNGGVLATHGHALLSPVRVGDEIIGLVCMSYPRSKVSFDGDDLMLLDIVTAFIGNSLHAIHLQNVLRSRFAQIALAQRRSELIQPSIPLPNQMARILAKTFYSEMTKAGFGSNQIISVASEIISQLSDSLRRHGVRLRDSDPGTCELNPGRSPPLAVANLNSNSLDDGHTDDTYAAGDADESMTEIA